MVCGGVETEEWGWWAAAIELLCCYSRTDSPQKGRKPYSLNVRAPHKAQHCSVKQPSTSSSIREAAHNSIIRNNIFKNLKWTYAFHKISISFDMLIYVHMYVHVQIKRQRACRVLLVCCTPSIFVCSYAVPSTCIPSLCHDLCCRAVLRRLFVIPHNAFYIIKLLITKICISDRTHLSWCNKNWSVRCTSHLPLSHSVPPGNHSSVRSRNSPDE